MARIITSGFEINTTTSNVGDVSIINGATLGTGTVRTGSRALAIALAGSIKSAQFSFVTPNTGPLWLRFYLNYTTAPPADNMIANFSGVSNRLNLRLTSTGALKLFNATTQIGSTTSALSSNTWYRIEMKFDESLASGSQVAELSIDGSIVISSSTQTYAGTAPTLLVGGNLNSEAAASGSWFIDDLAVNTASGSFQNTYPGAGSIIYCFPAGAGDSAQWTKAGSGPAATNWQGVIDNPPDDGVTFNSSSNTAPKTDMFTIAPTGIGASDTISLVAVGVRYANDTASAVPTTRLQIEKTSAGTILQSADIIPNSATFITNGGTLTQVWAYPIVAYQNPDAVNWTQSTVDSMQIGYKLTVSSATHVAEVTSLWAVVEYVPFVGGAVVAAPTHMMNGMGA